MTSSADTVSAHLLHKETLLIQQQTGHLSIAYHSLRQRIWSSKSSEFNCNMPLASTLETWPQLSNPSLPLSHSCGWAAAKVLTMAGSWGVNPLILNPSPFVSCCIPSLLLPAC